MLHPKGNTKNVEEKTSSPSGSNFTLTLKKKKKENSGLYTDKKESFLLLFYLSLPKFQTSLLPQTLVSVLKDSEGKMVGGSMVRRDIFPHDNLAIYFNHHFLCFSIS